MDSDRVMVLDAGRVVELGHPHVLLQQRSGHLYRLVEKTGDSAQHLRYVAERSYNKRVMGQQSSEGELSAEQLLSRLRLLKGENTL